jgi:hypothetical protein
MEQGAARHARRRPVEGIELTMWGPRCQRRQERVKARAVMNWTSGPTSQSLRARERRGGADGPPRTENNDGSAARFGPRWVVFLFFCFSYFISLFHFISSFNFNLQTNSILSFNKQNNPSMMWWYFIIYFIIWIIPLPISWEREKNNSLIQK